MSSPSRREPTSITCFTSVRSRNSGRADQRSSERFCHRRNRPGQKVEHRRDTIVPLLQSGPIKPIVARTFPLTEASDALRYLIEDRPFSRVVLTILEL